MCAVMPNIPTLKLLLQSNIMWDKYAEDYVKNIVKHCPSCMSTAHPQARRMVSISTLSKEFNEILCVNHFYLDTICLVHFMDLNALLSTALIVESTNQNDVLKKV